MTKPKGPTGQERARRMADLQTRIDVLLAMLHEAQTEYKVLESRMLDEPSVSTRAKPTAVQS